MSLISFFGSITSPLMRSKKCLAVHLVSAFSNKVTSKEKTCTRLWAGPKLASYLTVYFLHKVTGEALVISARDMAKKERRLYGKK
jgi:uncharacterized DUF497 family protein